MALPSRQWAESAMYARIHHLLDGSRDGTVLDRRRIGFAAAILLAIQLAVFAFIIAGTHGWIVPAEGRTTTDFVSFYAAGALADAGTPALAYNQAAHLAAEEQVAGAGIGYQYFNYPPVYLLLCAILAKLPYLVSFVLFETVTLLLYLIVAARILGDRSAVTLTVLLAFPIVFWNLGLGQNAFLSAALFGGATLLLERRPAIAGILLGALCYKPQLGVLVPFALIAGGEWRAFIGATASVVLLVLASLALFGSATWLAFLNTAGDAHTIYESGRISFGGMANSFGAARLLGASAPFAYAAQAAASVLAAAVVVTAWRRRPTLPTRAVMLLAGALVAAPLSLLYDLMLGVIAAAWLVRDRASPAAAPWESVALALLYMVLLCGRGVPENWHIPVFPLAALGLFAIAIARMWRETASRGITKNETAARATLTST
ncbi:MAG TPA: glycosyltransferase family 87 protein [Stellaceae bacterium]|jgi:hypothetical protein|nr:glycosyltransferase family 87 protein [Stellaceae bacterium]